MPSTLPGFASGGQPIVSGNPWSGSIAPQGDVRLRLSEGVSGLVYVGVALGRASGGITLSSGGAFSSGGLSDGYEMGPGDEHTVPRLQCSGQIDKIQVIVPATVSGTMRLFWDVR